MPRDFEQLEEMFVSAFVERQRTELAQGFRREVNLSEAERLAGEAMAVVDAWWLLGSVGDEGQDA